MRGGRVWVGVRLTRTVATSTISHCLKHIHTRRLRSGRYGPLVSPGTQGWARTTDLHAAQTAILSSLHSTARVSHTALPICKRFFFYFTSCVFYFYVLVTLIYDFLNNNKEMGVRWREGWRMIWLRGLNDEWVLRRTGVLPRSSSAYRFQRSLVP